MMKRAIKNLRQMPTCSVYRRADGTMWAKMNERFHVPAQIDTRRGVVVGNGTCVEFDPEEIVTVVQL